MFSELIKSLRAKSGLSQSALAKSVGVSPGNVGDWETGRSKPGYNALAALTRVFDVSADYLLELDASPVKRALVSCSTWTPSRRSRASPATAYRWTSLGLTLLPCSGSCLMRRRKTSLTSSISSTSAGSNVRGSLFTGHTSTGAKRKKATPPRAVKPRAASLDFLRLFD